MTMMMTGDHEDFPLATDEHTITAGGDSSSVITPFSRRPALLVQRGPTIGDWHLFADATSDIIVGRGDSATFQLRDASVSREHAAFGVPLDGGVTVEDLGSTNGTRVNNKHIETTTALEDGDLVRVGDVVLRFRLMDSADVAFQRDISTQVHNARKDAITGLFSRRYLDEQLPQLVKGHRRNNQPISLLMLDLDYFKQVNDNYGHLAGDTVLAMVAKAVQGAIRTADSAVRYGGEEFCVVLPGTRLQEARIVAERVREAIEAIDFSATHPELRVTGSLGVATLSGEEGIREWLQRADIALFTAKHDGRNRVEVAPASINESNELDLTSKRLTMRQPTKPPPTDD